MNDDPLLMHAERLLADAAAVTARQLDGIRPPRGYITEREHLQPTFKAALLDAAANVTPTPAVSPSLLVRMREHFERLGPFDVSLAWPDRTVYGELKAGGKDDLGHCAWDSLKCAATVARGFAAATYLIAAGPAGLWTAGALGAELFDDRDWQALDLRERYAGWFRMYEQELQRPLRVTKRLRTRTVVRVEFQVADEPWLLAVTSVAPAGDNWIQWPPFYPDRWRTASPTTPAASVPASPQPRVEPALSQPGERDEAEPTRHIEQHPYGYAWRKRFADAVLLAAFEGGAVYAAVGEGAHWVIQDEGTMADLLDPVDRADLRVGLVKLERFDTREAWMQACRAISARSRHTRSESADQRENDVASTRAPADLNATQAAHNAMVSLSAAELFSHWAATMRELRRRGLIRTDKSPLGDFAEFLVARAYGVEPEAGAANPGYDLRKPDGTRVQVKARKYTATGHTGHFGDFGQLHQRRFDEFVGVLFEEDFSLRNAWTTTYERVVALAKPMPDGKHRLSIAALRNDPASRELDLRAVAADLDSSAGT